MIQRPKKVNRVDKNYLTNEKYQDYAEKQFKTIYDYLDKITPNKLEDNTLKANIGTIADNLSYRIDNIVHISFKLTGANLTSGTNVLATIDLKPIEEATILVAIGTNTVGGWIRTNGQICVVPVVAVSNAEVVITGSYIIKE